MNIKSQKLKKPKTHKWVKSTPTERAELDGFLTQSRLNNHRSVDGGRIIRKPILDDLG